MSRHILLGLFLAAGLGCANVQPVGPMAKIMGTPKGGKGKDPPPDAVAVAAPRPTPPAMLVTPGEVTADNPTAAAQKLLNEYEYDRKSMTGPPRTAEVSVYKGGEKVR